MFISRDTEAPRYFGGFTDAYSRRGKVRRSSEVLRARKEQRRSLHGGTIVGTGYAEGLGEPTRAAAEVPWFTPGTGRGAVFGHDLVPDYRFERSH